MDRRPRIAATGAIAATALIAVAAFALKADAPAPAHRQTYLQFNLCGNACSGGGLGIVNDLVRSIRERRPFAVTLNEVCENQYDRLRGGLAPYTGQFDPTGATCHNGARYGNAVLVRASGVRYLGSWGLPSPAADEARRVMCVETRAPAATSLVVCVTHISNVSGNIAAQVTAVAGTVADLATTNAVLLGGDFNTDPADPRLDPLYGLCGSPGFGGFRDADWGGCASRSTINMRDGSDVINEDTYGRHKFDYIFLSDADWFSVSADAIEVPIGLSDHDALWTTAMLRPEPRAISL